jgi:transglutaminase superfamily protein
MGSWQTFSRLTAYERRISLEAAMGLMSTWVGLRLAGFRRWKSALEWTVPHNLEVATANLSPNEVGNIVRMEAAAARNLFFSTNCLEQSLVLWWLLRRRGIAADLRIGARKAANRFEAHAWVECSGTVWNSGGEDHLHFVPFEEQATGIGTN